MKVENTLNLKYTLNILFETYKCFCQSNFLILLYEKSMRIIIVYDDFGLIFF
jgi:hypothetical protein